MESIDQPMGKSARLLELVGQTTQRFEGEYAQAPHWIVAAPGRVNLIGEHVDYNDGVVLPMAIDRYVVMAASPGELGSQGSVAEFYSVELGESCQVLLDQPITPGEIDWSSYLKGVIAGFVERGYPIPPFRCLIQSSVPLGGGLSSSAALEVALATLLETILGVSLCGSEKALLCQAAERQFAGVPCGVMDQFASVYGKENRLLLLDCRSNELRKIPFESNNATWLVVDSKQQHALASSEYSNRRNACEEIKQILGCSSLRDVSLVDIEAMQSSLGEVLFKRARHVVTETPRTLDMAEAIGAQNWERAGQLMDASHRSLRDDYDVSSVELDLIVSIAQKIGVSGGVFGSRMTGAGFGGCVVCLVRAQSVASIIDTIEIEYESATRVKPTLFESRPAAGASVFLPGTVSTNRMGPSFLGEIENDGTP